MAFCSKKKNKCWVWLAYDREGKRVCAVQLGQRDAKTGQGLWEQIEMFDMNTVCTDHYSVYRQIIPKHMHKATKTETFSIEGLNSRIRHYLARFRRKTFCYSKAIHMIKASLTIFFTHNWIDYLF